MPRFLRSTSRPPKPKTLTSRQAPYIVRPRTVIDSHKRVIDMRKLRLDGEIQYQMADREDSRVCHVMDALVGAGPRRI